MTNRLISLGLLLTCLIASTSTRIVQAAPPAPKMPTLAELLSLPRDEQVSFIGLMRKILVEMDRHSGGKAVSFSDSFLGLLYCSAFADGGDPYCLNQGIVLELGQDGCQQSPDMHNFKTGTVLKSKYGFSDAAVACPGDEQPCSPFFGISDGGTFHCSDKNLTPACDQETQNDKTSFLDALTACSTAGKGKSIPSKDRKGKISCDSIVKLYADQSQTILDECDPAQHPGEEKKYCQYVFKRVQQITAEVNGNSDLKKALDTYLGQVVPAVTSSLSTPTTPCSPAGTGPAPASLPPKATPPAKVMPPAPTAPVPVAAAAATAPACSQQNFSAPAAPAGTAAAGASKPPTPADNFVNALQNLIDGQAASACSDFQLPGSAATTTLPAVSRTLHVDESDPQHPKILIDTKFAALGATPAKEVKTPLDEPTFEAVTNVLSFQDDGKISLPDLLNGYLPQATYDPTAPQQALPNFSPLTPPPIPQNATGDALTEAQDDQKIVAQLNASIGAGKTTTQVIAWTNLNGAIVYTAKNPVKITGASQLYEASLSARLDPPDPSQPNAGQELETLNPSVLVDPSPPN